MVYTLHPDYINLDENVKQWSKQSADVVKQHPYSINYTKYGDEIVNKSFRNNALSEFAINLYNSIAAALTEAPVIPSNTILYRGILGKGLGSEENVHESSRFIYKGTILENVGFTSTSLLLAAATNFTRMGNMSVIGSYIIQISIPNGVKGLYFGKNEGVSEFDEYEVLLGMNSIFKVTDIKYDEIMKIDMVYADLIGFNTPTNRGLISLYNPKDDIRYNQTISTLKNNPNSVVIISIKEEHYSYERGIVLYFSENDITDDLRRYKNMNSEKAIFEFYKLVITYTNHRFKTIDLSIEEFYRINKYNLINII